MKLLARLLLAVMLAITITYGTTPTAHATTDDDTSWRWQSRTVRITNTPRAYRHDIQHAVRNLNRQQHYLTFQTVGRTHKNRPSVTLRTVNDPSLWPVRALTDDAGQGCTILLNTRRDITAVDVQRALLRCVGLRTTDQPGSMLSRTDPATRIGWNDRLNLARLYWRR